MSQSAVDDRPALAMVCNTLTPYRINLHRLLAREIPELRLLTIVTHGAADFRWQDEAPAEINVLNFARKDEPAHGGMLVAPWTDWRKGAKLIRYFRDEKIAAAIFTGYGYPSHLRLLRDLTRRGVPFFLRNDANIYIDQWRSPWRRKLKGWFFHWTNRRAAGIMPMGSLGAQYFAKYGVPESRMYFVPYTPDYDYFAAYDAAGVAALQERFGLSANRRRLLYSGRLAPVKRVDLLIDAFAGIADSRQEWDLAIVGAGQLESELKARVPARLQSRVIWTGFLESQALRDAYHACDALVLPSMREAWAVVVQEAMAAGIPVVSSDVVGAAADLVEDGASGRIFSSGDLDDLISALLDVTDPQKIDGYKAAAAPRLAAWRRKVDVVREVRRALVDCRALPDSADAAML